MGYCYKRKEKLKPTTDTEDKTKKNQKVSFKTSWKPKQFQLIQLKKQVNQVKVPVMQRQVVINKGTSRQLMDDENMVASIDGDISEMIHFSQSGLQEIKNRELRNIAAQNNGTLTSSDILAYLVAKNQKEEPANQPDEEKIRQRKNKWKEHLTAYNNIHNFSIYFILFSENLIQPNKKQKKAGDVLLRMFNELSRNETMVNYAGKDYYLACIYILTNRNIKADNFPNDKVNDCLLEIQRRHREMKQEMEFCLKEIRQNIPNNPPDKMYGSDCFGFASIYKNDFDDTGEQDPKSSLSNYSLASGYNGHFFLWLTGNREKLQGGATVETCAGKGGYMRAVFSIRPGEEKQDNPISLIDKETIIAGFQQVNKDSIRKDEHVMNYRFQKIKEYIKDIPKKENGKPNMNVERIKEVNYTEVFRVYRMAIDKNKDARSSFEKMLISFFEKNFDLDDRGMVKLD